MGEAIPAGSSVNLTSEEWKNLNEKNYRNFLGVSLKKVQDEKETYAQKLETAKGDNIFKYLLLIDTAALEGYVSQTRLQAQESFRISKWVAIAGFILIAAGIGFGIVSSSLGVIRIDAAYLSSLAGILTEFISGVFFYLYNRTLQQLNLFHDKMLASKQIVTSFLVNSQIEDKDKRDDSKVELSKLLISASAK